MNIIGIQLEEIKPTYCYTEKEVRGNSLVVEIEGNEYLGKIVSVREAKEGEDYSIYLEVKRFATKEDLTLYNEIAKNDVEIMQFVQKEADKEGLDMRVFRIFSSLDHEKVKIIYTSEQRVDFRNLLKVLAKYVKARIEMRQVGPRDKAQMVGGIGVCGLPLCCSTFLNTFDGIGIAIAKNQMLAINIPKLSGQCGKLICCLKFEDDSYTEAKKDFPKIGAKINYNDIEMSVNSYNVLNKMISLSGKIDNSNSEQGFDVVRETIPLEEYEAVFLHRPYVKKENNKNDEFLKNRENVAYTFSSSLSTQTNVLQSEVVSFDSTTDRKIPSTDKPRVNKENKNKNNKKFEKRRDDKNPFRSDEKWLYHGKSTLNNQNKNKGNNNSFKQGKKNNNFHHSKNNSNNDSSR